jgi:hypothetical protein
LADEEDYDYDDYREDEKQLEEIEMREEDIAERLAVKEKRMGIFPYSPAKAHLEARKPVSIGQTATTNILSLLGLGTLLFVTFVYFPQYSLWAVVGSSALLALYHPWRRGRKQEGQRMEEIHDSKRF